ncbi:type IV pilus modification PilV family protein [Neobacillus muris]|uniref:type IV pilus modification PilV family protein n=1 Tax=Neobacillus muris TaxID=2941334 RepID=UPI00203BBBAC|nr:type II secretion system protein [Neobacillus muris]
MNENGLTLVEILVSIVILSIILLSFSSLFIFSNKTAVSNNEKLVAVHLAKATLERIKVDPFSYINIPDDNRPYGKITFNKDNCPENNKTCQSLFLIPINNRTYNISVAATQTESEENLKFVNIVVEVQLTDSKPNISSKVEGYVNYE